MHDAIRAHVLLCFMGLMMGKFLEIKTGLSLRRIRDILWNVQEAHIQDKLTGKRITLQTNIADFNQSRLAHPHHQTALNGRSQEENGKNSSV
jgi:hypothetical protein